MPQIQANGLQLEYESFGDPAAPAVLLIMGLGVQLIGWPDSFCERLVQGGYRVIRFDNRDIGLSEKIDAAGKVRLMRAGIASMFGRTPRAPYTLDDMALDSVGLLDALGLRQAHLVGVSMGGMIAQIIAARFPQRVLSLVSIMSTSGDPRLPGPSWPLRLRLVRRPQKLDRETLIQHSMQTLRMLTGSAYPLTEQELRTRAERAYDRSVHPRGVARHTVAILASGSRVPLLSKITAPTLIIHGNEDRLVPVAAAYDLAARIRGAGLEIIPGMGHDLSESLVPKVSARVLQHLQKQAITA